LADRTGEPQRGQDEIALSCLVCRKPQVGDSGGETRYSGGRRVYVCSSCLPAWKASELWNSSAQRQASSQLRPRPQIPPIQNPIATTEEVSADRRPRFELTAPEIRLQLDRWIVGQEAAKVSLSTLAHRHYMRVRHRLSGEDVLASEIPRENVLIVGPTGSGKTELVKRISSILSVPRVIVSASHFTEEGYYGSSVNDVFHMMKLATGGDGSERWGMIFWDEIDKKAKRETGNRRDVLGLGVQQALLDQLDVDGRVIDITGNRQGERERVDTTDMMFVLAGAFSDGLDEIVRARVGGRSRIGFSSGRSDPVGIDEVCDEDIERYGFIPEFCGRIGHILVLEELTGEQMRSILFDVENAPIPTHVRLAEQQGFRLDFSDDAIDCIIERSVKSKMGARKLKSLVSRATLPIFHDVPNRIGGRKTTPRVTVTADTVADPSRYRVR